jgi:hypothetical protein
MEIQELIDCSVTAIHYPTLSEYYPISVSIEDFGNEYRIGTYWIEKEQIVAITNSNKVLNLELKNGKNIKLNLL